MCNRMHRGLAHVLISNFRDIIRDIYFLLIRPEMKSHARVTGLTRNQESIKNALETPLIVTVELPSSWICISSWKADLFKSKRDGYIPLLGHICMCM